MHVCILIFELICVCSCPWFLCCPFDGPAFSVVVCRVRYRGQPNRRGCQPARCAGQAVPPPPRPASSQVSKAHDKGGTAATQGDEQLLALLHATVRRPARGRGSGAGDTDAHSSFQCPPQWQFSPGFCAQPGVAPGGKKWKVQNCPTSCQLRNESIY